MSRRALLIFANHARLDLARRALPRAALPLLQNSAIARSAGADYDVHLFGALRQRGDGFAARLEHAIETLSAQGYDEIVAVGRDCPALSANDITQAFAELRDTRLVLGPDHRGGCYLIAFRAADRALLQGIRWQRNTDCAQLQRRCEAAEVALLSIKHDIDSWADARLAARADERIARRAAFLFQAGRALAREVVSHFDAATHFVRLHGQIPPPCAVS
ncbi:MAG: TIGR04282 family arsenosugar biosynthesis glycosyltransferase [Chthoniobacterales bacterium]